MEEKWGILSGKEVNIFATVYGEGRKLNSDSYGGSTVL